MATHRDSNLTTKVQVKSGWGIVHTLHIYNPNDVDVFYQIFDALAADVTLGVTVPTYTLWVPANGSTDVFTKKKKHFHSGITIAATTGADNGTTPGSGLLSMMEYD